MILFLKPVSDNVLMLLATSTKFTPKERDVVIPKIMSGKKKWETFTTVISMMISLQRQIFDKFNFYIRCIHIFHLDNRWKVLRFEHELCSVLWDCHKLASKDIILAQFFRIRSNFRQKMFSYWSIRVHRRLEMDHSCILKIILARF